MSSMRGSSFSTSTEVRDHIQRTADTDGEQAGEELRMQCAGVKEHASRRGGWMGGVLKAAEKRNEG